VNRNTLRVLRSTGEGASRRVALAAAVLVLPWTLGSGAWSMAAAFGPVTDCPPAETTFATLMTLRSEPGPLAAQFAGAGVNEAGLACVGDQEVSFVAFRANPEGLGGVVEYTVEPAWLGSLLPDQYLAPSAHADSDGILTGPFMAVAVAPEVREAFDALAGRWVVVKGHFDDPAARTCHLPEGPTPDVIVQMCRAKFVVTGVSESPPVCPEPPFDWDAIARIPEHLRAVCLSGNRLDFEARAYQPTTVWPVILPAVAPLDLLSPTSDDRLDAFLPDRVAAAVPAELHWPGGDDPAPPPLVRLLAHVDDASSITCQPDPETVITDIRGRAFQWSLEDAQALCRNSLFIDSVLPARNHGTSPAPAATGGQVKAGSEPTTAAVPMAVVVVIAVVAALIVVGLFWRSAPRKR